jgi:hypothetical protein
VCQLAAAVLVRMAQKDELLQDVFRDIDSGGLV